MPCPGFTLYSPERAERFCRVLVQCGNPTTAAQAAGWSRRSAFNYRREHPEFAEQWEDAYEEFLDMVEQEVIRRGTIGVPEVQYYQGKPATGPDNKPAIIHRYSDRLLEVFMRARRPKFYSDKAELHISGEVNVKALADTARNALVQRVTKRLEGSGVSEAVELPASADDTQDDGGDNP